MKISHHHRWILEAPITSAWGHDIPLPFLSDGQYQGSVCALNLAPHGMDVSQIASVLFSLAEASLILTRFQLSSVGTAIDAMNVSNTNLSVANQYSLTHKGFSTWEQFARPNWEQFTDTRDVTCDDRSVRFYSATKNGGEQFAAAWCRSFGHKVTNIATSPFDDWCPLPWKTFDKAYRVDAEFIPESIEPTVANFPTWIPDAVTL